MTRILEKAAQERDADLEAWETALRAAVLAAGAKALGALLEGIGSGRRQTPLLCQCGTPMQSRGRKEKRLFTILGPVAYRRSRFVCPVCRRRCYPGDEALDIRGTTRSPGLRRMMARAGSKSTFKEGRDDLRVYAGIEVSAKDVERVAESVGEEMEAWSRREGQQAVQHPTQVPKLKSIPILYVSYDGTGVPMTWNERVGRKGKQADGSAKTREAKLGCVFTQTTVNEKGFPVRDPESTTFVGAIERVEAFGWRIYEEAVRRGLEHAQRVVVLGDGAEWVKGVAEMHFPGAIPIIDLYHAREHVANLCKLLFPADETEAYRVHWWACMDEGAIEKIAEEAQRHLPESSETCDQAAREINYLVRNKERMRYGEFRRQGLFVGSGVVEAGCKTVVGQRLKQSGMEWSVRGANAILSLRCMMLSDRLDDYWESRTA